jgi:hypothetical protein
LKQISALNFVDWSDHLILLDISCLLMYVYVTVIIPVSSSMQTNFEEPSSQEKTSPDL